MPDAKADLFAAQKPLRAPNGPESADQREARLSLWPDEELAALSAWLRVAHERNGSEANEALSAWAAFSDGADSAARGASRQGSAAKAGANEGQRALGVRSIHEALERLEPLDALWAAARARGAAGALVIQELIQRHCRGAQETPSWDLAAQNALLDEIASACGGASVAEWASATPGAAPEKLDELADFWSLAGEKRRVEGAFQSLKWACWMSEKKGGDKELISLAWKRACEWSSKGNPKKTKAETLERMCEGGFWEALAWHARNGANIAQSVWEAALKNGVAARCAPDGDDLGEEERALLGENIKPMGKGQKDALAALSQSPFRPQNATVFFVEAMSQRQSHSWDWARRQAPITPKTMFGLLEWWAFNERDILSCEAFEWQNQERFSSGQTEAEAKAWAPERLGLLMSCPHWPAGAALAAIWEIAVGERAYLLAAAALEKGAQASGVGGQGIPLGKSVGRREFDWAEKISRAGGWGAKAERLILDLPQAPAKVSPATPAGQRAASTEAWKAQARSRQEARELQSVAQTAQADAIARRATSDRGGRPEGGVDPSRAERDSAMREFGVEAPAPSGARRRL